MFSKYYQDWRKGKIINTWKGLVPEHDEDFKRKVLTTNAYFK